MAIIGYHASHEQFAPGELLTCAQEAERAGFTAAMCSDHFAPWSEQQGQSGFAWSWLGAAMQATSLSFGVVNAPGDRYHPAIIAQAAATLENMFPGRFWVALGSGEAMNEHITGARWPKKPERNERLRECIEIIRALWAGETVTHDGLVRVDGARLWTRPEQPPLIVGPALSEATAEVMGGWADALITVNMPHDRLARMIAAFRRGGGEGKPLFLKCHLSYAATDEIARANAFDQWRANVLPAVINEDLQTVEQFTAASRYVRPEDLDEHVCISADLNRHLEWLRGLLDLGLDRLYLHNVGRNQREFIEAFGQRVLPSLV
jgi:probable non-F420 flavinoid oxidoreductase